MTAKASDGDKAKFAHWLHARIVRTARGDDVERMDASPSSSFWLGRLSFAESVVSSASSTTREERLDPCAFGIRLRPASPGPFAFVAEVACRTWTRERKTWVKGPRIQERVAIRVEGRGTTVHGADQLQRALTAAGCAELRAEVQVELQDDPDGLLEMSVLLVNTTPEASTKRVDDPNLFECRLVVRGVETNAFLLEGLPDSYRYDRRVPAYGINCGVERIDGAFATTDDVVVDRGRPSFWNASAAIPDLRFDRLADDPLPPLAELVSALKTWGEDAWSEARLDERSTRERWTTAMRDEARRGAEDFAGEVARLAGGLDALRSNASLLRSFRLMNAAMSSASGDRYDRWRPFQIGFLLANVTGLLDSHPDRRFADIVWFATGGGKTETYLGLVLTAAFLDRIRGKRTGITAWSRFPLRMLSLQQTQRFADALAAAEVVRAREHLGGDPFSVGFFVGSGATPNKLKEDADTSKGEPDPDDPAMPNAYQVLLRCPFCRSRAITMAFDRRAWMLEHRCGAPGCPWQQPGLPFYVVDDDIYRRLPTVIVGTLDKAALISMQASMRGFVGAPWGRCSVAGHGFVYAPRKTRPAGCLVPGCKGTRLELDQPQALFAPSLRLQDELHLLRDSLGAIDAHYEAILDALQAELGSAPAKVLGSSATLAGYEKQADVLYRRQARVFPVAGPRATEGFWSSETTSPSRRFVALAPRGGTVEFAVDRTLTELQRALRELRREPARVCEEVGVDPGVADELLSLYGVDVAYGNTLRDIDAVTRSFETQVRVDGALNTATMTGRTGFDEVRGTLERLDKPEARFDDRIHLVAASSMMSHGVDIDRLNLLVMLGFPLTTAEFIQTSARVGRTHPGVVFVIPRMARERDAGIYRAFTHFVRQGDRFVEAIPITRRSRRVLERTMPGIISARLLHLHEPAASGPLTSVRELVALARSGQLSRAAEERAVQAMLELRGAMDEPLLEDLDAWLEDYFSRIANPPPSARFPSDLMAGDGVMRSLRDVEEQVPVSSRERRGS